MAVAIWLPLLIIHIPRSHSAVGPNVHPIDNAPHNWAPLCPQVCQCELRPIPQSSSSFFPSSSSPSSTATAIKAVKQANSRNLTKTVDCSSRNLNRIPRDLPLDAEVILLQNNSITMHVGLSQMPHVGLLNLSHNAIQAFYGRLLLPQLQHLDMSHNLISRVSHGDNDFFAPLKNLRSLILRGNSISSLDYYALDLPNLHTLDLGQNRLVTFSTEALHSLPALNWLDLSMNKLTSFTPSTIDNQWHHLELLNLSWNKLSQLGTDKLRVGILDVRGNAFGSLSRRTWNGIDAEFVDLQMNENLWTVRAGAFIDGPSMRQINLGRNNRLEYIEDDVFKDTLKLERIILDQTGLVHLPRELTALNISMSLLYTTLPCNLNTDFLLSKYSSSNTPCLWKDTVITGKELSNLTETPDWHRMPPSILPTFPRSLEPELGSILEIQCRTAAGNASQIDWFRLDNRRNREYPLPSQLGLLKAGPLYRVDSGVFVCRASNEFGSSNRSVKVTVTYAPVVLIPLAVTHQYITFAWNNSDPSIASQFRISYFEHTSWSNWTLVRIIFMEHLVRTYTISNLKANTLYMLCISLNKSGALEELDCKNVTTKALDNTNRTFQAANEVLIVIACISSLLFIIFTSTCVYRYYQERQQERLAESLSRILLSDSSCMNSEATTPTTYFNPGVDPLTPTTDMDVRAAFLPVSHPYRNTPFQFTGRPPRPTGNFEHKFDVELSHMEIESGMF